MIKIAKYLNPDLVMFLNETNRDDVLQTMVNTIYQKGLIPDSVLNFYDLIIEREKVVSTGIGMGVAIPHAKVSGLENFFIAIGILTKGVDWHSIDSSPVRLVFMIGGPDDKQTEYLQILSNLTLAIKNEEKRKKMLTLNSSEGIIQLFTND
ncbi:EIIABC-Fru [Candidatus Rubidus massiliensis]|nr:MAG: PTS sugar transporter subunit IIA [Chlamydia sp. 32-24]CDZ79673.1 EIIABC-Fru [Candidatus Rubidus massiliensis]